jgi:hypothetical protein
MGNEFVYLYPYSREEARRRKELDLWRDSHRENIACKNGVESAIRRDFDGAHLKDGCAQSVIAAYGYKRVSWVLANAVQQKAGDGHFAPENQEWAKQTYIPPDKSGAQDYNLDFLADSPPAALEGFIHQYRGAYQALGLFEHTHCDPDSRDLDFKGKVMVLSQRILKESCWSPQDQLWLARDGFGCAPDAIGRSIRATCLADGETVRWNRHDFTGVLKDELLPDWARERLAELQEQKQENSGMGGMEMK